MNSLLSRIGAMCALMILASPIYSSSLEERDKAFKMLYTAYSKYTAGNEAEGRKGVEAALKMDPDLAYGNIVMGEISMRDQDWLTAQKYYEKGLALLKQPNQPLSPDPKTKITVKEVEGDTRCFLGYVYIKQAQRANQLGNEREEQRYLELSEKTLQAGLKLNPGAEARDLAENLLRKFR